VKERITDTYVKHQKNSRINIDTSHRCPFRCPQCVRQKTISQDMIRRSFDLEEHNFKKILDYYEYGLTFCGQISDPIYHPRFLNFLKMCHGQKRAIRIATVGSGKSDEWWDEAYSYGLGENQWTFGVDGIDEKSELYRVGSNFKDQWRRMQQGRDLGHVIVWQYIIFGYNEHEIDRAIEIAKQEDIALLFVNTNRGFNPESDTLRKNVNFKINSPDEKHRDSTGRMKKEWYGHVTETLQAWRDLPPWSEK